jgi:hypothetical protein
MTFIFLQIIISFMNVSFAQTKCTPKHDFLNLNLVNPASSTQQSPVLVRYEIVGDALQVQFQVNSPVLHKKDVYGPDDYPFEFDVAEVFITVDDVSAKTFSYYEFEVTPLGQVYDLRLDVTDGKRKGVDIGPITTEARFSSNEWSASFLIPLSRIGSNGDLSKLRGNFFTIIGKNPRTYWSAFLPQQQKANFHKPEFFQPLFDCK